MLVDLSLWFPMFTSEYKPLKMTVVIVLHTDSRLEPLISWDHFVFHFENIFLESSTQSVQIHKQYPVHWVNSNCSWRGCVSCFRLTQLSLWQRTCRIFMWPLCCVLFKLHFMWATKRFASSSACFFRWLVKDKNRNEKVSRAGWGCCTTCHCSLF